jgi:hypothetical protein
VRTVRSHFTPNERSVLSMSIPGAGPSRLALLDGMYCWPVAEV